MADGNEIHKAKDTKAMAVFMNGGNWDIA